MTLLLLLALQAAKSVPPPGIEVPAADRAELEKGLKELSLGLEKVDKHWLAADARVFHKAVDWALHHNEFFTPKEIAAARDILKEGMARVRSLQVPAFPWAESTGPIVRAYVSKIDGSVQPYGLVVPASWKPGETRRFRLDFWLHGRDEKLTELKFIDQRRKSPGEFTPPDAFVLHLYGRLCNASKFAGEVDLFEALEEVKRWYPIDENRLVVRGFSMGGASTWHLAAHHAGLWAAAAPGAGFAETPVYANVARDPVPPAEWEKTLWRWYNATDYAANLFNCPVVAYSGEIDKQKQAADIMAAAMKEEGLELVHLIGPKTEHKYEPQTKAELSRRIDEIAAKGREPWPSKVRFTTWTLRYNRMEWIAVEGLGKHWERARVDAELACGNLTATTSNVTAVSFSLPDENRPAKVTLDGQSMEAGGLRFHKEKGQWVAGAPPDGLRKRSGLQGPIDDAFMDRFVMVTPTGAPLHAKTGAWVQEELKQAVGSWRRFFRGDAIVVKDMQVDADLIRSSNLVLWGDPKSNSVISRILKDLPLRWDENEVKVGDRTFPSARHVPVLIHPNPLNPARYVVLNSGYTFRENSAASNSRHVPLLPDWALLDVEAPAPARLSQRVAAAGFFSEDWKP